MDTPKVFISYSHDSLTHKEWVLTLGTRLRSNGIDAILDQWELSIGDDLPNFMEKHLSTANYIIMVCTERYTDKANNGTGGVGYEKMIITSNLMDKIDETKIIPIIRQNGNKEIPTFLKTKLYVDFSIDEYYESSFDELIRKIHQSPIFKKPPIGNNPFANLKQEKPKPIHSNLLTVMQYIIYAYEKSPGVIIYYNNVRNTVTLSRITLDVALSEAAAMNLISFDSDGDIILSQAGKEFAIKNGLVK